MAKVTFSGFGNGEQTVEAKVGDIVLRVADANSVKIPRDCQDGNCASCAVKVIQQTKSPMTQYMEDKELTTLVVLGAITQQKAEVLQMEGLAPDVRLACQCIVKGDIEVKPYEG